MCIAYLVALPRSSEQGLVFGAAHLGRALELSIYFKISECLPKKVKVYPTS